MDKTEKFKQDLFNQLLEDSREKIESNVNGLAFLMSLAFNFGFEEGYKLGYKECEDSPITSIDLSDNIE